ncbi:MAG: hypothetical protein ACNS60_02660 [Candidatus Cyclobacteriaceae bacterium M2_1C_046]
MKSENKIKITALVVTVFFLASLGMMIYHVNVNDVLKKDLTSQKLKSEKLLSEKLNLDKQIKSFKENLASLQGKNAQLDKYLKEANKKVSESESTIAKLNRDNASLAKYKKELQALKNIQEELNAKITQLTDGNKDLTAQLANKDQMLVMLQKEQKELLAKYNKMEQEKLFADNFRIESLKKKNDKLTVKASKTNNIMVSFDIPEHLMGKVNENSFKLELTKPVGVKIEGNQFVTLFDVNEDVLTAGTEMYVAKKIKRANISFKPTEKLQKGVYTVSIYEGKELLGNAQIRLMK